MTNTLPTGTKKSALLLSTLAASLLLGACGGHSNWTSMRTSKQSVKASSARKDCKPSQYWDGEMCRHKGQGKGARKHDG